MQTFKCVAGYDHGKFETDSITATSPTGKTRSVWLHKPAIRELPDAQREAFGAIVLKFSEAYSQMRKAVWAKEQELHAIAEQRSERHISNLPEWQGFLTWKKATYHTGMYSFYIELTADEMRLIDSVSDQKIDRFAKKA